MCTALSLDELNVVLRNANDGSKKTKVEDAADVEFAATAEEIASSDTIARFGPEGPQEQRDLRTVLKVHIKAMPN